jgi:hypothetical protein
LRTKTVTRKAIDFGDQKVRPRETSTARTDVPEVDGSFVGLS